MLEDVYTLMLLRLVWWEASCFSYVFFMNKYVNIFFRLVLWEASCTR